MEYKFNDGVLLKKEVSFEYNRIMLLIVNKEEKFLMTCKDSRYTFPYFDVPKDVEITDFLNGIQKDFQLNEDLTVLTPCTTIEDYQYRYVASKYYRTNNLVNLKCYKVTVPDDFFKENYFFMHLFEIRSYLDQHNEDDDYYHYDDRILDTILSDYMFKHTDMLFDPEYYKRYLLSYYHYKEDDTPKASQRRQKFYELFIGDTFTKDICKDSRYFISSLFDRVNIINKNYATLLMQNISGLNNGNKDWYADVIGTYNDDNGEERFVSLFILRNILGTKYKIYLTSDHEEIKDDNGNVIGEYIGFPLFYIKGDTDKLLDIMIKEEENYKLTLKKEN